MKLAFIIGNMSNGGAQRVISIVTDGLARNGHDVHLLLFNRCKEEYYINPDVKVTSLKDSFEEYSKLGFLNRISAIRKMLKTISPDVAVGFTEGGYALFLSSFGMKFPKVASARISPHFILAEKGLRAFINKLWFKSADAVVLQTKSQEKFVPNKLWKNMVIIPNPINEKALASADASLRKECKNLIMVGRLDKQKNYIMAFKALNEVKKKYPEIVLTVFGKGSEEEKLSEFIRLNNLEDSIILKGWSQDVIAEYGDKDLYLMTSDYEGMPNALMEAMACGLPSISTDCPTGPSDIIKNGENGFLVDVGDYEALAQKIIDVIEMPFEERQKIASAAQATMRSEYTVDIIVKQWQLLLERLGDGK